MTKEDAAILSQHSILEPIDLDETRHCVSQKFCDNKLEINDDGTVLSLNYNDVAGQNLSVNYLHCFGRTKDSRSHANAIQDIIIFNNTYTG